MHRKAVVALIALSSLTACESLRGGRLTGETTGAGINWNTSGSDETGGYPARDQFSKPGGNWDDDGIDRGENVPTTGVVFFGPKAGPNGGHGAANSTAWTEFMCGEPGGRCEVKMNVIGTSQFDEFLVMTLQHLDDQGQPTGTAAMVERAGTSEKNTYTLVIPECGRTRLTISFREKVSETNPPGIQTKFNASILKYGCRKSR